jgi:purine-binding chemotaxis protein CheW
MEKVYLGFKLNNKTFGVAAEKIVRVSQIVEITSIPNAPETVMGIINVMGEVVPVIDLRKRLNLPPRPVSLSDYLIIAKNKNQTVSFVVDAIIGLIPAIQDNDVSLKNIIHNSPLIERVIKENDEFILIIDSEKLINNQESQQIQEMVESENGTIYTTFSKATA